MTNDFKKTTLDYITGNLEIEDSKSISFRGESQFQNNLSVIIEEMGIPLDVLNSLQYLSTDTTSNYILWGNYRLGGETHGIIIVCNQDGGIERIFLAFDSGTLLNSIECLEYDENGNIYGIDYVESAPRIILLNNIALKTANGYSCKLRASYYIPSPYKSQFTTPFVYRNEGTSPIKKVNGEAVYYIVGTNTTSGYSQDSKIAILEFVNIVGAPNEWNLYTGETIGNVLYTTDFIIEKDDSENVIDIYCQTNSTGNDFKHYYFNGETITSVATYTIGHIINDIRIKSSNEVYFCGKKTENLMTKYITYQLIGGSYFKLFEYDPENNDSGINYLTLKNNILFETIYCQPENEDNYTQCLVWNENKLIQYQTIYPSFKLSCVIQNTYALYKFILQDENKVYQPSIVIYDSSYSGESYINYNALVSLHGELYSNNNIIFARNLYNKSSLNNTTTSVLEVPFNYINDILIDTQNLLSATQLPLINNQEVISKNIYENLFINFINTINVIDEDTSTNYPEYAIRVNNSLITGTKEDYEGNTIQKVRINTEDNQIIQKIYWKHIDDTHLETEFTIYIDTTPSTIEFMNMDETYIYFTKDISNLEVGKYYTINQKIRME